MRQSMVQILISLKNNVSSIYYMDVWRPQQKNLDNARILLY